MNIATLPPSNHINALRVFINHIRRTKSVPSAQELAHAEDSVRAIEIAISMTKDSAGV